MSKRPSSQRGTNPPTRDINAGQRASQALALRAQRLTYEQIAGQCGYATASACRKAILREMDRTVVSNVNELRREQLHELDCLQAALWPLVIRSAAEEDEEDEEDEGESRRKKRKGQPDLWAVDRLLTIMERRARLMGLAQTPDAAAAVATVVVREVPMGYLGLEPAKEVQA